MKSFIKAACSIVLFTGAVASTSARADACPTGGVISSDRAYFGTNNAPNVCSDEAQLCTNTYFFELGRYETAECTSGTWVVAGTNTGPVTPVVTEEACPTGGVLEGGQAWFGNTLSNNSCSNQGQTCSGVYFHSIGGYTTAECSGSEWVVAGSTPGPGNPVPVSCPKWVFANGEIWDDGEYLPNSCDADSSVRCDDVYFYELPDGGYGYRSAACVAGQWAPESELATANAFVLRPVVNQQDLLDFLRDGLQQTYGIGLPFIPGGGPIGGPIGPTGPTGPGGPVGSTGPGGAPSGTSGPSADGSLPVSETNVQEQGVDEEDRIKSDGEYLYILKNNSSVTSATPGSAPPHSFRVVDLDPDVPSAAEVFSGSVSMRSGQRSTGLYLYDDRLTIPASGNQFSWNRWYNPFSWLNTTSTVVSLDVSAPGSIDTTRGQMITFDGEIISSRRVEDTLYVATRFQPSVPGLSRYDPFGPSAGPALGVINNVSLGSLLPTWKPTPTSASQPLVAPEDCYLPTETAPVKSADVITVLAIDLGDLTISDSKCYVGSSETIYVSTRSIYLATTRYEYDTFTDANGRVRTLYREPDVETDVHKFALEGGQINYRASAVVDGHLGWRVDSKPFRFSESGDDLRIITFTGELTDDESPVAVTVVRDNGTDQLVQLGRIPNANRPQRIGKPGEELYATRFVGDRAYLVTFQVIDPLYVVDLSNPSDPFVAGELEIAGYSDYLHPLPNDLLIGVGKDAIPDASGDLGRGAWYQGVKLALFDVSDPENPRELDSKIFGQRGSTTPVLNNHRGFTYLPPAPGRPARIAFGIDIYDGFRTPPTQVLPRTFHDWMTSGLYTFEVDVESANPQLDQVGTMIVETANPDPAFGFQRPKARDDRAVLVGDAVFYVHGDDVFAGEWQSVETFSGPH